MESIINEIVDEICYLVSINALRKDAYIDELIGSFFDYSK